MEVVELNVNFLEEILTLERVGDALSQAVKRLVGQPVYDAASAVQQDFPLCTETLEARCAELPRLLGTIQQSAMQLSWSV
jgi:hypothetical protein